MSKRDLMNAIRSIVSDVSSLRDEVQSVQGAYSSILVRLSVLIAQGAPMVTDSGSDWRDWAVAQCKGFGPEGGDLSPSTAYRLRNAGAVAQVLGDDIGDASYLSLVPLYRFLASAKSEEETETAHKAIRTLWSKAKGKGPKAPTAESVLATVETAKQGTRGSKGADATERKAKAKAKAKRSRNTPTETTETTDTETDPGARDACRNAADRFIRDLDPESAVTILGAMLMGVKLAENHSVSVTDAILREVLKAKQAEVRKAKRTAQSS